MSTLLNLNVNELTLDQRVNARGSMAAQRGLSYVNYNDRGEVVYRSELLANLRGESKYFIEMDEAEYGVFTEDPNYVADAIYYGSNEPIQFERDYEGNWIQMDLDLEEDQYTYYSMILVDNCWCYLSTYLLALDELELLIEKESIRDSLLKGRVA